MTGQQDVFSTGLAAQVAASRGCLSYPATSPMADFLGLYSFNYRENMQSISKNTSLTSTIFSVITEVQNS